MQAQDRPRADAAGFDQLQIRVSRMLTRENSAAAKKAFIATNRKIRNTRKQRVRKHGRAILAPVGRADGIGDLGL